VNSGLPAAPGPPSLAIVIPAYRAAAVLPGVVARTRAAAPDARIIVVDDGSADATPSVAARAGALLVQHPENQGKGRALASGLAAAVVAGADVVVTMDADGQHPPEAVPLLVAALQAQGCDLVVGSRERTARMPRPRQLSNWLSSALVSRAMGLRIPDSQSGFRAMRRRVAEAVRPSGAGYEYETEFLLLAARRGFRIGAVAVPTVYDGAPSHFRYGADTLAVAGVFLRHWRPILLGPESR
jgi:glycosyltransferase involved in cell wall biosynthesis